MNTTLNQLLTKKSQLKTKYDQLGQDIKAINDQIGAVKFGVKIGDKIEVPQTQNIYVVAGYDIYDPQDGLEDMIYVQLEVTDRVTGEKTLRNMQEAKFWFDYKNGKAKSPTRR